MSAKDPNELEIRRERIELDEKQYRFTRGLEEVKTARAALQLKCWQSTQHRERSRTGGYPGGFTSYVCNTCGAEFED